jgi:hypothetical protein
MQTMHETTYLDIQQYPDVFQSGLCKILEEVGEARHWLMRFLERSQLAQKLIIAVNELLIPPKAALQVLVLASLSTWILTDDSSNSHGTR